MLHWGLGLVAAIIPVQMFFGHLTGEYVLHYQPAKFAAIEARWTTQQPASEVLIGIPDPMAERNLLAIDGRFQVQPSGQNSFLLTRCQ
jgi:cytochrome d ubiquinol oxidase subunit I